MESTETPRGGQTESQEGAGPAASADGKKFCLMSVIFSLRDPHHGRRVRNAMAHVANESRPGPPQSRFSHSRALRADLHPDTECCDQGRNA